MKVKMWNDEAGVSYFSAGEEGARYLFDVDDDDSVAVAFTKAVNDIIESDEEVEGTAAQAVAVVLKEAGAVMWAEDGGYEDLRCEVQAALPKTRNTATDITYSGGSDYYVKDIALDARHALICGYVDGKDEHYVIPFDRVGDEVVVGDKSAWVEVEQEFVAKAGRMFSARNLSAMEEARDALEALIQAGHHLPRKNEADAEEAGEEDTQKAEMSYTVEKADGAMRYTMGPLYAPMREDAHGEWIEDDELHKSLHEFVRTSSEEGRRINLQHKELGDIQVGEWVEVTRWPYEHTVKMTNAKGEEHEVEMPAGTTYMGIVWDEEYWDADKKRPKGIDGLSLAGRAMKVRGTSEDLKNMGYKVTKAAPEVEAAPEPAPEVAAPAAPTPEEQQAALELTAALAKAKAEADQGGTILDRVLKIFEKQSEHPPVAPVHHTHLPPNPDTVVNINEQPLEPDTPEAEGG